MASPTDSQDHAAPRTLATAGLPRRVRRTLERALALFSEELERSLVAAVSDYEEELFRMADRGGTTGGGTDYLQTLRVVRLNRHDLVPRYMQLLEAGLAGLRKPNLPPTPIQPPPPSGASVNFRNLSLVDDSVMDEGAVLHEIASRQESRANLALHLLGQRFGVLAAAPSFDSERNPLGPQALCRAMRHAVEGMQLDHGARLLFYRVFDRRVMVHYLALCEKLEAMLMDEGVLPGLSYVPMRTRAGEHEPEDTAEAAAPRSPEAQDAPAAMRPRAGAHGNGGHGHGGQVAGGQGGGQGQGVGHGQGGSRGTPGGTRAGGGHGQAGDAEPRGGRWPEAGAGRDGGYGGAHGGGQAGGHDGGSPDGGGSQDGAHHNGAHHGGTHLDGAHHDGTDHDSGGAGGYLDDHVGAHDAGGPGAGRAGGSAGGGQSGARRAGAGQAGRSPAGSGTSAGGGRDSRHRGAGRAAAPLFGGMGGMLDSHDAPAEPYDPARPHTTWMGQPTPAPQDIDEQSAFHDLQELLTQRRAHAARHNPVPPGQRAERSIATSELLQSLGRMDTDPAMPGGAPPSIADIKQSLLAQARQHHGKPVALAPADNDTFDLVGLLYNHLQQEIRDDAPAAVLVKRLQLTLLRVALQDRAFFVRPNHPARQLLGTVSETAAKWLSEDDFDPQLLAPLQQAVTHAVKHYDGDLSVFEQSNQQLQTHIDAQVRRAETMERRHVEAARGKEKLEAAKLRACEVLAEVVGEAPLPKFTRALLNQAWTDVLTLSFLRHGDGSQEWDGQIDATRQIVAACTDRDPQADHQPLKAHVEAALKQVGYHDGEADVIARRLSSNVREEEDGESRTELTMKLKARVRLGEESHKARKPDLPPRSPQEQECYEHLRLLPFGTWMEFVTNQQGDVVRRRMSWFSPVTDNALFVNQRGQRIGEHSLDSLARMMAKDQVRIVTLQRAGLVDRAWNAALSALRSLTGRREDGEGADAGDAFVFDPPAPARADAGDDSTAVPPSWSTP